MSRFVSRDGVIASGHKWLIFDAVGTLIQPTPPVAVAYQTIASRYGSQSTVTEVSDRFRQAFRQSEVDAFPDGPSRNTPWASSNEIEFARWRWIVGQVVPDVENHDQCFREMWDYFARPTAWSCFHDVRATLMCLRNAGYRLAIASNFDSRLHAVCDGMAELQPIEHRFVSSETGFRKPAPDFYSAIIRHCDCPANEILMVGDDAEHDVAGPLAVGMAAILLDRKSEKSSQTSIGSLSELIEVCRPGGRSHC